MTDQPTNSTSRVILQKPTDTRLHKKLSNFHRTRKYSSMPSPLVRSGTHSTISRVNLQSSSNSIKNKVIRTHGLSAWLLSLDTSEGMLEGTRTKSSVSSGLELLPWPLPETGDPAKINHFIRNYYIYSNGTHLRYQWQMRSEHTLKSMNCDKTEHTVLLKTGSDSINLQAHSLSLT